MKPQQIEELSQFKQVYFLGIGGIGMSALARWFLSLGMRVGGYDKTPGPVTEALISEGCEIWFDESVSALPAWAKENKETTLVVLTPAIPASHAGWQYLKEKEFTIQKRSQVLGLISRSQFTIAVAGTHGKTTTSSMLAYLLTEAGKGCTAFLGGIAVNYNSNFLLSEKPAEESLMVVEADEFDRSFLTLFPAIAILTSTDADHLDIYGDDASIKSTYAEFIGQIKREGKLIIQEDINLGFETRAGVKTIRYGKSSTGNFSALNIRPSGFGFDFEVQENLQSHGTFHLPMPGFHNVENALAAMLVCRELGISWDTLRSILPGFKGVKRRFEKVLENDKVVLIDDYAHHPSEIQVALSSLRTLYPNRKLGVVFQPHLFSRTRDFALGFSQALNEADQLWLLDIYPARENPIPGITSKIILDRVDISEKKLLSKENLVSQVLASDCSVVVVMGAGDIDRLVAPLAAAYQLTDQKENAG